jgi:hypothetical protein
MITFTVSGRVTGRSTPHFAERLSLAWDEWRVSWIPEPVFTRNQAVAAIALAADLAAGLPVDALMETRARELALAPDDAVARCTAPVSRPAGPSCPCGFGPRCFGTPEVATLRKLPGDQTVREQIARHLWAAHHLRAFADRTVLDGSASLTVVHRHCASADLFLQLADELRGLSCERR